jgi:uncharacterized protein
MKQSLRALLEGARQKEFGAQKAQLPEECRACRWLSMCFGGCVKDRLRSGDGKTAGGDYFCRAHQMIFEHTRETMLELKRVYEADQARRRQ